MLKKYVIVNTDAYVDDLAALVFLLLHPHLTPIVVSDERTAARRIACLDRCLALLSAGQLSVPTPAQRVRALLLSRGGPPVDYLSIGPLRPVVEPLRIVSRKHNTNDPTIDTLVIMGGAISHGNITSFSEYNFYTDARSAKQVFHITGRTTRPPVGIARIKLLTWEPCIDYGSIDIERYVGRRARSYLHTLRDRYRALMPVDEQSGATIPTVNDATVTLCQEIIGEHNTGSPLLVLLAVLLAAHQTPRHSYAIPDLLAAIILCYPQTIARWQQRQIRVRIHGGAENGRCIVRAGSGIEQVIRLHRGAIHTIFSALFNEMR